MHLRSVAVLADRFPKHDVYPFNQALIQNAGRIEFNTPITFFIGENGSGKSTLLNAICRKCGIAIWREEQRRRAQYNPYEDLLFQYLEVDWAGDSVPGSFFGSDIFRTFAEYLDEWAATDPGQLEYFGGKSLLTQSHGQSLMSFFKARYRIKGLYLLDEPETALSPKTQIALLHLLEELSLDGHAQFIIATHSPILLACRGAAIYSFQDDAIRRAVYEETDVYRVYKDFMNDRSRFA